jgi:hypothetical protein
MWRFLVLTIAVLALVSLQLLPDDGGSDPVQPGTQTSVVIEGDLLSEDESIGLPARPKDAEVFIFSRPTELGEGTTGMQGFGQQSKVGIESRVADEVSPSESSALAGLLTVAGERDTFLVQNGYEPRLAVRFWKSLVQDFSRNEDGGLSVDVIAGAGARECGMCVDGTVSEKWQITDEGCVLLDREFISGFQSVGPFSITGGMGDD